MVSLEFSSELEANGELGFQWIPVSLESSSQPGVQWSAWCPVLSFESNGEPIVRWSVLCPVLSLESSGES